MSKQPKSTAKAQVSKTVIAEKTTASNPAVAENVVITPDETAVAKEVYQMEPNEVLTPEHDIAVAAAAGVQIGELGKAPVADTPEAKEAVKAQKEVVEKLSHGESVASGTKTAYDVAVAMRPLVSDPITGRIVAETAEQSVIAQSIAGELATEAPAKKK